MPSNKVNSKTCNRNENMNTENNTLLLNMKLTEEVKELSDKNAELQNTIAALKTDLSELSTKHNRLIDLVQKILKGIIKDFLPNTLNMVNMFYDLVPESQHFPMNQSSPNKDSVKTHAVKPQIVNGNVLYSPTVSLTRFNLNLESPFLSSESMTNLIQNDLESHSGITEIGGSDISSERSSITQETNYAVPEKPQNSRDLNGRHSDLKIYLKQLPNNEQNCSTPSNDKNRSENKKDKNDNDAIRDFLGDLMTSLPMLNTPEKMERMRALGLSPVYSLTQSEASAVANKTRHSRRLETKNLRKSAVAKMVDGRITKSPPKPKRSPMKQRNLVVALENISLENILRTPLSSISGERLNLKRIPVKKVNLDSKGKFVPRMK